MVDEHYRLMSGGDEVMVQEVGVRLSTLRQRRSRAVRRLQKAQRRWVQAT